MVSTVTQIAAEEIARIGFTKRGRIWQRDLGPVEQFLDVQRSAYSPMYFLNLGILLREIEPSKVVKGAYMCHIVARAEGISGDSLRRELMNVMDEEKLFLDEERRLVIRRTLETVVVQFFSRFEKREAILDFARTPRSKRPEQIDVWWPLLEYVGIKRKMPHENDFDPEWIP